MVVRDVQKLEKIAFILKTIAHPVRLQIVETLEVYGDLSVSEICEKLKTEQSLTSHHLSNMKLKGILSSQKEGRRVIYSLKEKSVLQILNCLDDCNCNMG
ncbi:MAG: ArsR/SmtB family transcription factor [Chitinophagales bacterium]